ncbi:MAG TPA: DUF6036 family nucleotidyltransferase, partial [Myxococcota bacterium]|nr:DUF6036 family nucleotidyltransferase [Myxococcota bacterium]
MEPREVLAAFESRLVHTKKFFEAIVVGGAALVLLGVIRRRTRGVDVLMPDIPPEVLAVAHATAAALRADGVAVRDDWLNNGPKSLQDTLPAGWRQCVVPLYQGPGLVLWTLGRSDRGADRADCLALRPTAEELQEALPWVVAQDAHPGWPEHVRATLAELAQEL